MSLNVFLSVGRTATPEQQEFVTAIGDFLAANDLVPRTVGRTDFAYQKPLERIAEVMQECCGTIIVAFERLHISEGVELRGGSSATDLTEVSLPTVWNQIEAAMAYALGHPLLAIVESNLRNEGLLEEGYDWFIKWVNLDPVCLDDRGFQEVFANWKNKVAMYQAEQMTRILA